MNNFFTYVQRINTLLIFGGLVLLALFVLIGMGSIYDTDKRDVVTTTTRQGSKAEMRFHLDDHLDIPGTDTHMLKLTASKTKSGGIYSGYERDMRNILFLSDEEKPARWLFSNQSRVIHTATQLQAQDTDNKTNTTNIVTVALYYVYSEKDTTGDGEITQNDKSSLGLSHANGEGFTTVLTGIDRVYSVSLAKPYAISVLYRIGKELRHARYSVETLAKLSDRKVTAIPGVEYRG